MTQTRRIWLTRHGESSFNERGLIGGDSEISANGEQVSHPSTIHQFLLLLPSTISSDSLDPQYARHLPDLLIDRLPLTFDDQPIPVSVWTSTLKRTIQTASYLPFPKLRWEEYKAAFLL